MAAAGNGHAPGNGLAHPAPDQNIDVHTILQAVEAIYDPHSTNDTRIEASKFIENIKSSVAARDFGLSLALDGSKNPTLRHYGLSVLEWHIKVVWDGNNEQLEQTLKGFIVQLAHNVTEQDPGYLRNKVGHIWAVFAKRSLGAGWKVSEMDGLLAEMFKQSSAHRDVALCVLQTLAEDVFRPDDPLSILRAEKLGVSLIMMFMPTALLDKLLHGLEDGYMSEGWIPRLCTSLEWLVSNDRSATLKSLSTLAAALSWAPSSPLSQTEWASPICKSLTVQDDSLRLAGVEALLAVCSRERYTEAEFLAIIVPLIGPNNKELLRLVYADALVDASSIDDVKYDLLKKTCKLIARLTSWAEKSMAVLPSQDDAHAFLLFTLDVVQTPCLSASEPVLRSWNSLLRSRKTMDMLQPIIVQVINVLMGLCNERLKRYDHLPDDSEDPIALFLAEDFDSLSEKQSFLNTYRRYCTEIVESLVRRFPVDAITHILSKAGTILQEVHDGLKQIPNIVATFDKNSTYILNTDAQVMMVTAATNGYKSWVMDDSREELTPHIEEEVQAQFGRFCETLLSMDFPDPAVQKRVFWGLAHLMTRVLSDEPIDRMLRLLRRLLETNFPEDSSNPEYAEAVKLLHWTCIHESHKLAHNYATVLWPMYDQLEQTVHSLSESRAEHRRLSMFAFLFIIVHRTHALELEPKLTKLRSMITPSTLEWQRPEVDAYFSDIGHFCETVGFAPLPQFLFTHDFHKVENWGSKALDVEGQTLRAGIVERLDIMPHRVTRILLMATFDKLSPTARAHPVAVTLWRDTVPIILPNLLQSIRWAHSLSDPKNWPQMHPQMQSMVGKMLVDRFWQAGISNESVEAFYARVNTSKDTYEGLASAVRGTLRQVREKAYNILTYLVKLGDAFYGVNGIAEAVAQYVIETSKALSVHQTSTLLHCLQDIIMNCPPENRPAFLPPVLRALFQLLNEKLCAEWEAIAQRTGVAVAEDHLGEEMKAESVLRILTHNSVMLVDKLLQETPTDPHPELSIRRIMFADEPTLSDLLMLLRSALRMRDTRSCSTAIHSLSTLLPDFNKPSPVHDFLYTEVLKTAITSFNEPYFVDAQRNLATLIAQICLDHDTAFAVLTQLPGLGDDVPRVERALKRVRDAKSAGQGAAVVMDLLHSLRGVSIHELGKIERTKPRPRVRDAPMDVTETGIRRGGEDQLDGVATMFGKMV
ncbi:hypothetical protein EJ06DRAFT_530797 [Trichodelitschia bisporula]|uniref:Exportin-5 C-terminal domain-containing protein n=1 Tax=Trichodelitschia bisporula TaxID=703511 RepID=A0A6G1HVJ8_9PEZI|nr:hypothetical protein EJ06DRAFT_530797 [Trichodelitschia bisporula]